MASIKFQHWRYFKEVNIFQLYQ